MSGVQVCKWGQANIEKMSDSHGPALAAKWFGMSDSEIQAKCGRFAKGANKGKLRGWIVWRKVEVGGWSFKLGGVAKPGIIVARFEATYNEAMEVAMYDAEKFSRGAKRVDEAYGYNWREAEAKRAAEAAERLAEQEANAKAAEAARANIHFWVELVKAKGYKRWEDWTVEDLRAFRDHLKATGPASLGADMTNEMLDRVRDEIDTRREMGHTGDSRAEFPPAQPLPAEYFPEAVDATHDPHA
jgi:hypothetical protein